MSEVKIARMIGGGISWWYAIRNKKVIGASHEDDKKGMEKLRKLKEETGS